MRILISITAVVLLLLQGGAALAQSGGFAIDFSWSGTASCFDPQSPPFSVRGVPAGTKRLRFTMIDLDAPNFLHGGGVVAYSGQDRVDRGAFTYLGPCPPGGPHTYRWTVEALDGAGRAIATATAARRFPP